MVKSPAVSTDVVDPNTDAPLSGTLERFTTYTELDDLLATFLVQTVRVLVMITATIIMYLKIYLKIRILFKTAKPDRLLTLLMVITMIWMEYRNSRSLVKTSKGTLKTVCQLLVVITMMDPMMYYIH